ncbi:MAG TPA: hypothetical protein VLZ12_14680 [Verrucomicrobiae bacterium]|nr:hypothetical protein [Verrucomicrobiae bacterium]
MNCRWFLLLLTVVATALGGACASTKEDNVSTIPWDRPQNWEGQGALGGFRPPGQ